MARTEIYSGKNPTSQPQQRRSLVAKDQFGRPWGLVIEVASGDLCGAANPRNWRDPLRTPQQYVRPARTEEGTDLTRVEVNLAGWLDSVRADEQTWYFQLNENALRVYKAIDPADVANLEKDRFLIQQTGPKPWPASEVLQAAIDGDRQYLGFEPLDKAHRAKLLMPTIEDLKGTPAAVDTAPAITGDESQPPEKYQDFVSWAMKKKVVKDLREAAALWKEHRANLAGAEV